MARKAHPMTGAKVKVQLFPDRVVECTIKGWSPQAAADKPAREDRGMVIVNDGVGDHTVHTKQLKWNGTRKAKKTALAGA